VGALNLFWGVIGQHNSDSAANRIIRIISVFPYPVSVSHFAAGTSPLPALRPTFGDVAGSLLGCHTKFHFVAQNITAKIIATKWGRGKENCMLLICYTFLPNHLAM
jgi:hypothetical protein